MHRNNRFLFQQDNARPHIARLSMNFLQSNNVNTLPWPSRSPDLVPIEHVWDMLNRRIRENHHPFNSLQELENALIIELNTIPQYKIKKKIIKRHAKNDVEQPLLPTGGLDKILTLWIFA
jgi:transposase